MFNGYRILLWIVMVVLSNLVIAQPLEIKNDQLKVVFHQNSLSIYDHLSSEPFYENNTIISSGHIKYCQLMILFGVPDDINPNMVVNLINAGFIK
jgi:hypothetical protein